MIRNRKLLKAITAFLLLQFSVQLFFPTISYALTSGPAQPEFSSFEPVATTNMVDEFTGDFTYNLPILEVPGPHGSSYPLSLSYHSGATPEEEASWVGFGWTLNPGAINRGTRGLPDDYKEKDITFHNKMPKNWTVTVGASAALELFGKDVNKILPGTSGSASLSLRYNNYRGFGYNAGLGISLGKGLVSMGYSVSDGDGSYSLNVNPFAILNWNSLQSNNLELTNKDRFNNISQKQGVKKWNHVKIPGSSVNLAGSSYGIFSYTQASKPNIVNSFTGKSFNVSLGVEINPGAVPIGKTLNLFGSYAYQENRATEAVKGFGYLYSHEAEANLTSLMDYHVEHEKDFNPRDVFLGVPFNDADNFIVTGEGLGGGFRLYNKTTGHFGPRKMNSHVDTYNIGGEVGAGWTFGPGADLGKGSSDLSVEDWKRLSRFEKRDGDVDEPVFFRFNNDLGGEWGTIHDDKPFQAKFNSSREPELAASKTQYSPSGERSGRSSYIGYHTNAEMLTGMPDESSAVAYSKIKELNQLSQRGLAERADLIGEIAVFNETGIQYNYGLPVYNKDEKSLSYSAKGLTLDKNFRAFTSGLGVKPNDDVKVGEVKDAPYASTYLLTEILTPDYLDRGGITGGEAGASPDDLGGYTRFNYHRITDVTDWYIWRTPYRGLIFNKNSHSDPLDDMASYSEGAKEIYYLYSIETKTHVAIFKTSPRIDSQEAVGNEFSNVGDPTKITTPLEKLDRIELYSIDDFERDVNGTLQRYSYTESEPGKAGNPIIKAGAKPIKTVHFEYDYSQTQNLPNNSLESGKLTLTKVYFEYNGVKRARISPYEFKYSYPNYSSYPDKYTSGTDDVTEDFASLSTNDQNPAYSYFLTDAWGNYQKNGDERFEKMRSWVDQSQVSNKGGFDPAAWQLKVIKLPSGGEIHIQYEQDDYSFVQDQEAHVMAKLKVAPGEENTSSTNAFHSYQVDLQSIGIEPNTPEIEIARRMFEERYVNKNKVYFKFLYSLIGGDIPNLQTCNAEFISGYASVANVTANTSTAVLTISLVKENTNRIPREVCKDFVKSQRLGKVDPSANCDPSRGLSNPSSPKAIVNQLSNMIRGVVVPDALCMQVNPEYSYFRIPTPVAKKGGGIRVKRLMMFDKGFNNNPVLYGSEYIYKTVVGDRMVSSGVATNEPMTIREENILVDFVARKGQSLWSKIVAGKDKDKAEGPLGESILPGPSVGYSQVIVKNIHSGKSNPGFSITEFYTAKDYPVRLAHPDKAGTMTGITRKDDTPEVIPAPFYSKVKNKTRATQGFSFVLNSMHGQVKRQATYSGNYDATTGINKGSLVSSTQYTYFEPGEKVPMMSSLFGELEMKNPGREVDITFAQRRVKEKINDVNVEVDLQVTVIPLALVLLVIPYPTAIPAFSYVDGELNTHVTTKVVRYPAIVKKVDVYQDGIYHTQENLAFDAYTGKPVAVRSNDEFKGAYLTQNIPASWEYDAMGGKWKNQEKKLIGTYTVANGFIDLAGTSCALASFATGDKIQLRKNGEQNNAVTYYVTELDWLNNRLGVQVATGSNTASGQYDKIVVIHTGRTNQLQQQAGAITVHDEVKDNLVPITSGLDNRYTTNDLINDLNYWRRTGGSGYILLDRIYEGVNMSAFSTQIGSCGTDLSNATVTNLRYRYEQVGLSIKYKLIRFEILCDTNTNFYKPIDAVQSSVTELD